MPTATTNPPKKLSFKKTFEEKQRLHEEGKDGEAYLVWEKFVTTLVDRIPNTFFPYFDSFRLSLASNGKPTYSKWFFAKMYFLALNSSGYKKCFWKCLVSNHRLHRFDFNTLALIQRELPLAWDGCVQIQPLYDTKYGSLIGFKISLTEFEESSQESVQKQEES